MNIKILLVAILLGLSLPVAAEFRTVSLAHEISLSNMSIPISTNAGVSFKNCDDCEVRIRRVTPTTQYIVNGRAVTLKEFRDMVSQVKDRANNIVTVLEHLETLAIVSVSVTI